MSNNELFKAGIELYTGRTVAHLDVFPDPKVEDAYALRATMSNGTTMDFLICAGWRPYGSRGNAEKVCDALEDVEYECWPPKVGEPRFFI